ncbi:hypothetical protein [Kordiimonas aquimaris]|uniref:hypothetical protein n=1 Tax=Kordiimonas aquimaris TaxID=707591 RepID=UPI0021D3D0F2|nr:hypothetical protein [Kordiimonas aquimaris]
MKIIDTVIKAASLSLIISFSANATYSRYWDVEADAGSYAPVELGDNITLNACGSDVHRAGVPSESYALCDISDTSNLSVNWYVRNNTTNVGQWLTGNVSIGNENFGNVNTNELLSITTGAGSFFNTVGTYTIGLYLAARNSSELTLGGILGNFWSDSATNFGDAVTYNTELNNGKNYATLTINEAVVTPVPEPESLLILLPALAVIARRQRRRGLTAKKV